MDVADGGFPIGEYWRERDKSASKRAEMPYVPEYCEGCPFIAPVAHGQEDSCSIYSNYKDVCTVTRAEREVVWAIILGKWSCDNCDVKDCAVRDQGTPCADWQPKGGE